MAPGSFATIQHRLPTHRSPTEATGTTVQWEQTRPRRQKDQEQVKKQARNHGGYVLAGMTSCMAAPSSLVPALAGLHTVRSIPFHHTAGWSPQSAMWTNGQQARTEHQASLLHADPLDHTQLMETGEAPNSTQRKVAAEQDPQTRGEGSFHTPFSTDHL